MHSQARNRIRNNGQQSAVEGNTPEQTSEEQNALDQQRPCADSAIRSLFPNNVYVTRLLDCLHALNVKLATSTEWEQWLYHPKYRTLWVWKPDLRTQPLSYIVVILAHEIGHVLDFDEKPHYKTITENLHWSEVPDEIERSAFVRGFLLLQQLNIPVTLAQYLAMIEPHMAATVKNELLVMYPPLANDASLIGTPYAM